eukprot:7384030-Prymnesium_polylepis.1
MQCDFIQLQQVSQSCAEFLFHDDVHHASNVPQHDLRNGTTSHSCWSVPPPPLSSMTWHFAASPPPLSTSPQPLVPSHTALKPPPPPRSLLPTQTAV